MALIGKDTRTRQPPVVVGPAKNLPPTVVMRSCIRFNPAPPAGNVASRCAGPLVMTTSNRCSWWVISTVS